MRWVVSLAPRGAAAERGGDRRGGAASRERRGSEKGTAGRRAGAAASASPAMEIPLGGDQGGGEQEASGTPLPAPPPSSGVRWRREAPAGEANG